MAIIQRPTHIPIMAAGADWRPSRSWRKITDPRASVEIKVDISSIAKSPS